MSRYGFCLNKEVDECYDDCIECKWWKEVSKEVYDKGINEYMKEMKNND
jgi:hypothetical protein